MFSKSSCQVFLLLFVQALSQQSSDRPNIVFILTDDQDAILGGTEPLTKTQKLIAEEGITFSNMYVTTPLCCPSRSSILTGKYVHNHGAFNNSYSGNCSSSAWQNNEETNTFAVFLKSSGYQTFFAGKYLNQYGKKKAGGLAHVPPGWDEWHGLKGNSVYYDYILSANGKKESHGHNYKKDYLTDVINKKALDFIDTSTKLHRRSPFFMMLSTPSCHAPFTSAPQYEKNFTDVKAPRDGSYNVHSQDKHWLIRSAQHPMTNESVQVADDTYRKRWRTLLSVDDLVESVVMKLKDKGVLESTYIIFTSDNGYHFGQFSMPYDKRQLYEFDIHVPFYARGPNIAKNITLDNPILNIDLAPTFIDIANGSFPASMDGNSMLPLLHNKTQGAWRTDFMVEHAGEYNDEVSGCPQYKGQDMANCYPSCVCEDSKNNTYSCVRTISAKQNLMYCQFSDTEDFIEVFDLHADPHQLKNIADTIDKEVLEQQNKRLVELSICAGVTCRESIEPWPPLSASSNDLKHQVEEKLEDNDELSDADVSDLKLQYSRSHATNGVQGGTENVDAKMTMTV